MIIDHGVRVRVSIGDEEADENVDKEGELARDV